MSKDPLRLVLTVTIGIIIVALFVWLVNTYIVSAIFKSRFDNASPTEIKDSKTSDTNKSIEHTVDQSVASQPKENSNIVDEKLPETINQNPQITTPEKPEKKPEPMIISDKGKYETQKDAYNI